ncbi:hypothetical protein [Brenneria rubrifaciens]|nr:hypothetical protein [Brenneria rubrifaciens]
MQCSFCNKRDIRRTAIHGYSRRSHASHRYGAGSLCAVAVFAQTAESLIF